MIDITQLIFALILAGVLWFVIRSWLIASMSNVASASEAQDYLKDVRITECRDDFVRREVSRRPKPRK